MKKRQNDTMIKDPAFRIPQGYFEQLEARLEKRIATSGPSAIPERKIVPLRRRTAVRWAAAAAIAVVLASGIGALWRQSDPAGSPTVLTMSGEQARNFAAEYLSWPADDTAYQESVNGNASIINYLLDEASSREDDNMMICLEQNDNIYALESSDIEQYIADHYNILELATL